MTLFAKHNRIFSPDESICLSKICEITKACDNPNLMVNIYIVKKNYFLYCSKAFKKSVGGNYKKILNEGWNFWFSLVDSKESFNVKSKIIAFFSAPYIQDSCRLKYHIINKHGERIYLKHEIILHKLEKQVLAVNYFFDITVKEKIERYFEVAEDKDKPNLIIEQIKSISAREKEVLKLVADGFSSKQIADRLFISDHTAISHRKNLIEKFKVKNTAHLIKRASRSMELW